MLWVCFFSAFIYFFCYSLLWSGWSFGWCWESTMEAGTHNLHTQAINSTSNNTSNIEHILLYMCINYNNKQIIFEWRAFLSCGPEYFFSFFFLSWIMSNSSGWSLKNETTKTHYIEKRFNWKCNTLKRSTSYSPNHNWVNTMRQCFKIKSIEFIWWLFSLTVVAVTLKTMRLTNIF